MNIILDQKGKGEKKILWTDFEIRLCMINIDKQIKPAIVSWPQTYNLLAYIYKELYVLFMLSLPDDFFLPLAQRRRKQRVWLSRFNIHLELINDFYSHKPTSLFFFFPVFPLPCWLLDMARKNVDIALITSQPGLLQILQCYYPETLRMAVVIHPTWIFKMMWAIVSPFMVETYLIFWVPLKIKAQIWRVVI